MTHDFHSLVKRWPVFLAALPIMLSFIMHAALSVDWHKVFVFVNPKRVQLNTQFVYA